MEKSFAQIVARVDSLRGGRSVSSFARFIGIPQKSLDNYLKQGRKPSLELILLVCSKCGVSADWLLGLSPESRQTHETSVSAVNAAKLEGLKAAIRSLLEQY